MRVCVCFRGRSFWTNPLCLCPAQQRDAIKAMSYEQCRTVFHISSRGFLPAEEPLPCLPPQFRAWDDAVAEMPGWLKAGCFQRLIAQLPLLTPSQLEDDPRAMARAYLVLSALAHGYVWGQTPAATSLPPGAPLTCTALVCLGTQKRARARPPSPRRR